VPEFDKLLTAVDETLEYSISPLVRSMDKKLEIDLRVYDKMKDVSQRQRRLQSEATIDPGLVPTE
jgi:hypothetical protein